MIKINKAKLTDLETIIVIEKQLFKTDSYPAFVVRQLFDISGNYFLVAKHKNEIIGYIIGGLNTYEKRGWILSLGVHEKARGKGLGKKLTEQLIKVLKPYNINEVALTVYPDNKPAITIYRNLGFKGDSILDNYFFDNGQRIVMSKTIN
ncbi:GNAT family N-acetyltransferase [Lacinutrix salivirga]